MNGPDSALLAIMLIVDHKPIANAVSYMFLRQANLS